MFFKTLSLLALIQVAVSTPPAAPLEVTTLSIFEPSGRTPGELYTVSFDVKDTGDQATTHCSVEWVYGTAVPGDYIPCADPGFAFKFKDYVRYFDFVLDVKHTNLQGTTVFADGAVLRDVNLFCKSASSGFTRCTQVAPPLTLEVYDVQS